MCQQDNENTTHIIRCQSNSMKELRKELLSELKVWLESKETNPDITTFPCDGLYSWFQSPSYDIDQNADVSTKIAFENQIIIEWESLQHVFLSTTLIRCQQQHYISLKRRKLGTRWGINLTIKLWQIIQKMWVHRNNVLHETDAINLVSGKEHLVEAVFLEH